MRARAGDHIVVAAGKVGGLVREGEVVEVPHADGSPPFRVRWNDDGGENLFFPGHDATIESAEPAAGAVPEPVWQHARRWTVTVDVLEHEDDTTAHAVLTMDAPGNVDGTGLARRRPRDLPDPAVGAEVATARALHQLADSLTQRAESEATAPVR